MCVRGLPVACILVYRRSLDSMKMGITASFEYLTLSLLNCCVAGFVLCVVLCCVTIIEFICCANKSKTKKKCKSLDRCRANGCEYTFHLQNILKLLLRSSEEINTNQQQLQIIKKSMSFTFNGLRLLYSSTRFLLSHILIRNSLIIYFHTRRRLWFYCIMLTICTYDTLYILVASPFQFE